MASADNLNLDCLELIFAYLAGTDLVAVSLVSKSFLAGVIPHLYRKLAFHVGNAKRWPSIFSPFDIIVQHPNLAVHVRTIDIRTVPMVRGKHSPQFLKTCHATIAKATNLRSFTCTPNILPSFVLALETAQNLEHLRINATLTVEQTKHVTRLTRLKSLSLDSGTWNVVDVLPSWATALHDTLTSLTFYAVAELHDEILEKILSCLPGLTTLNVMACTKVDHLAVLRGAGHAPNLENLAITAWDSRALPPGLPPLPLLRHLTMETHLSIGGGMGMGIAPAAITTPPLWKSMITATRSWSSPLESIIFRLSERWSVPDMFIHDLLEAHAATLRSIALVDCDLSMESVQSIAGRCKGLVRLSVYVPKKEVLSFAFALSHSTSIEILNDTGETHSAHGVRAFLTRDNVRTLMDMVPKLTRVSTEGRVWTGIKERGWAESSEPFKIKLEPRRSVSPHYWFLPPLSVR